MRASCKGPCFDNVLEGVVNRDRVVLSSFLMRNSMACGLMCRQASRDDNVSLLLGASSELSTSCLIANRRSRFAGR
jgi:hypothetical protein